MSPARIRTRRTQKGEPRYLVVYRMGGRGFPELAAGTFTTMKDARARRDFITGEIAAGRDPALALAAHTTRKPERTFADHATAMLASRHDLAPRTLRRMHYQAVRLNRTFGTMTTASITVADVEAWIAAELDHTKASTLLVARHTLRQILDHASIDPNPARSPKLRWPKDDREEGHPPPADHFTTLCQQIALRYLEPMIAIERAGLRVSEITNLTWDDVDLTGQRLRLTRTKTGRTRWAQLPSFLIERLHDVPLDDRHGSVYRITANGLRNAMATACITAGIPRYSPHDLRHRRGTVWHHSGVVARELAHRMGHTSTRETLDTYSHVMPPGEVADGVLADLVRTRCGQEGV